MAVAASACLVACGGGGTSTGGATIGSPINPGTASTSDAIIVTAGNPVVIPGALHTDLNLLKSMIWTVGINGGNTPLILSNDKCDVAVKNDRIIRNSSNGSTGSSDWSCDLGVVTPIDLTADAIYTIGLQGIDDKSGVYSKSYALRVTPNQAYLTANAINPAGSDFDVKSGGTAVLNCRGPSTSSYQWVVLDNAGYNINLGSTPGATSGFTAPVVRAATPIVLACRTTDKNNRVTTSRVTVTIRPATVVAANNAGSGFTIKAGQVAPLYCQGPSTNKYTWSVVSNAGFPITLSSYTNQQTSFVAPLGATAESTPIVLKCSVSDSSNVVEDSQVTVNVVPAASGGTAAGVNYSIDEGKTAPLFCTGAPTNTYQWAVTKNTAGLPITIASYTSQQTSFVAPMVDANSEVTLTCTESSASSVINTSSVVVTIKDVSTSTTAATLVAKIAGPKTGLPGQTLSYTSESGWFDKTGTATTGEVINYSWSIPASSTGFSLSSSNGPTTALFVPSTQNTAVFVPITLTATSGTNTSTSTLTVLIDPNGAGFTPTISPAAQTLQSGKVANLTVNGGTSQLYYQWTIVSGPVVPLGGETTATVGFVTPTVAVPTEMKLRAAIGYGPITVSNPGLYFVEGVVTVTP